MKMRRTNTISISGIELSRCLQKSSDSFIASADYTSVVHHGENRIFVSRLKRESETHDARRGASVLLTDQLGSRRFAQEFATGLAARPGLLLMLSSDGHWAGTVMLDGERQSIDSLRIVDAGMPTFGEESNVATPFDFQRWSRTIRSIGLDTWKRIVASRVLLIGLGRTGAIMAHTLAAHGVRRFILVDPSRVDVSQLNGSFSLADIGRPKVACIAGMLRRFNPRTVISYIVAEAQVRRVRQIASTVDLVVTCVESPTLRMFAARLANRYIVPHLDVGTRTAVHGTQQIAGEARLLLPSAGCVACAGGLTAVEKSEAEYQLAAPRDAMLRETKKPGDEERLDSPTNMNAITVSAAAQLWIDFIDRTRHQSYYQQLHWAVDGLVAEGTALAKDIACETCR